MNVTASRPAAKSVSPLSVAGVVGALDDIRAELMTDRHGRAWTSARILTLMAELEAAALPRISGGSPGEFDDAIDPAEWPAWTDADRWVPTFDGPTPDEVLAHDVEADDWSSGPTAESLARPGFRPNADDRLGSGRWTEQDQIAAHGCA